MSDQPSDIDASIGDRDLTAWKRAPSRRAVGWVGRGAQLIAGRIGAQAHTIALLLVCLIGGGFAAAATFLAGGVYDAVVDREGIAGLDDPMLREAIAWRSPTRDHFITLFTDIGGSRVMPILATAIAVGLAWRRHRRTPIVLMAIGAIGSLLLTVIGKWGIHRVRPDHAFAVPPFENTPSFPSGHTLNATVVAGITAYLLIARQHRRSSRIATVCVAAMFAVAMGLSRVFLGHHWFTDVVAAWALAVAWLAVVITAHRLHLTVRQQGAPVRAAADRARSVDQSAARKPIENNGSSNPG